MHLVVMLTVLLWHMMVLTQNYNFPDAIQGVPKNCLAPRQSKKYNFHARERSLLLDCEGNV